MAVGTPTARAGGANETDLSSYASASFTPGADRWLFAVVSSRNNAGATPNQPTFSGHGTWTVETTATDILTGSDRRRITLAYVWTGASPGASAVTFDFAAQTQANAVWSVFDITGLDTTDPIVQSATNNSATDVTSITVTLAAFSHADNATLGGCVNGIQQAITEGTGFTVIHENSPFNLSQDTQYQLANDMTCDWSWGTAAKTAAIAVELRALVAGGPVVRRLLTLGAG